MLFAFSSCVKDELYPIPTISELTNTIAYDETEDVTVTALVSALVPVNEVNLFYKAGSSSVAKVKMEGLGEYFKGVIPAQPMGTEVTYYVEATTDGGTATSKEASYTVGVIPIDFTPLKLNELNGNDKFIEIINTGSADRKSVV